MENQIVKSGVERLRVLSIPVDNVKDTVLAGAVSKMVSDGKTHQIMLLSLWDLMRGRRDKTYRRTLENASLVIPVSLGIAKAAKFLKRKTPIIYSPFDFVIKLLSALEESSFSLYLLGGRKEYLGVAEQNLRETFPGLRMVGRYPGYYPREVENNLIVAVYKSNPSLLLIGPGIRGKDKWVLKNRDRLNGGMCLWSAECFDIFSSKKKRISRELYSKGLVFLSAFFRKPWKILRLPVFMWYVVILLFSRIAGR